MEEIEKVVKGYPSPYQTKPKPLELDNFQGVLYHNLKE